MNIVSTVPCGPLVDQLQCGAVLMGLFPDIICSRAELICLFGRCYAVYNIFENPTVRCGAVFHRVKSYNGDERFDIPNRTEPYRNGLRTTANESSRNALAVFGTTYQVSDSEPQTRPSVTKTNNRQNHRAQLTAIPSGRGRVISRLTNGTNLA